MSETMLKSEEISPSAEKWTWKLYFWKNKSLMSTT